MKITPHSPPLALAVAVLMLSVACGDPIRSAYYNGPPFFTVRVRLPEELDSDRFLGFELPIVNDTREPDGRVFLLPGQGSGREGDGRERFIELYGRPSVDSLPVVSKVPPTGGSRVAIAEIRTGVFDGRGALAMNTFLVWAESPSEALHPLGPAGPSMRVRPGYQLIRRVCGPDGVRFEPLPDDTLVELAFGVKSARSAVDPKTPVLEDELALARCGLRLPDEVLGRRIEIAPDDQAGNVRVNGLSFSRGGERLYFSLGDRRDEVSTEIDVLDVVSGTIQVLQAGVFSRSLAVSPDGRFLLTERRDPRQASGYQPVRIELGAAGMASAPAPNPAPGLVSPDGRLVAVQSSVGGELRAKLHDLTTGEERPLPYPRPLVWRPDSAAILMAREPAIMARDPANAQDAGAVAEVTLDGVITERVSRSLAPEADWFWTKPDVNWLWTNHGPQLVHRPLARTSDEIQLVTLDTGERTVLLKPAVLPAGFYSWAASAVRPGVTPNAAGDGLVFLWEGDCAGFGDTSCTMRLHWFNLNDRSTGVVAVTRKPIPVAVSPDGKRLALADARAIYLQDLP